MAAPILTILKDGEPFKSQPVDGELLVGRGEGCVIRLPDRAISRQHAVFRRGSSGVEVERRSQFAPLVVNGAECTSAVLKDGDVISIGPYLIKLSGAQESREISRPMPQTPVPEPSPIIEASQGPLALVPEPASAPEPALGPAEPDIGEGVPPENLDLAAGLSLENPAPSLPDPEPAADAGLSASPEADLPDLALEPLESPEASDEDGATRVSGAVARLEAKLVLPPGKANLEELLISKEETLLGRGAECEVVLNDRKASRRHSSIRRIGAKYFLKDLGSVNSTYLNGEKIEEAELAGDDVIRIGDTEIRFEAMAAGYADQAQNFLQVVEDQPEMALEVPQADPVGVAPAAAVQPIELQLPQGAIPGLAGTPGLATGATAPAGKQSLLDKFRAMPPKKQVIWGLAIAVGLWFLMDDEFLGTTTQKKTKEAPTAQASPGKVAGPTFESLSAEQRRFVESQHQLAFDLFKNREYDKALFEVRKIFSLVPEYKDAREIERFAAEGKRKTEAIEEERRKKEEEAKVKAKVASMVEEGRGLMSAKRYDEAKDLFAQVLILDPENPQVADWKREIQEFEDKKQMAEQERQVRAEVNRRAWEIYRSGAAIAKKGKCHGAIPIYKSAIALGAPDKGVAAKSKAGVAACVAEIASKRDPVLAEAKQAEDSGDLAQAFKLFRKATQVDPPHPAGYEGMRRIRGILHSRSKNLYTEAVLAESYSDFSTARKKLNEILGTAPEDDIYHERAKRKLSHYLGKEEG